MGAVEPALRDLDRRKPFHVKRAEAGAAAAGQLDRGKGEPALVVVAENIRLGRPHLALVAEREHSALADRLQDRVDDRHSLILGAPEGKPKTASPECR